MRTAAEHARGEGPGDEQAVFDIAQGLSSWPHIARELRATLVMGEAVPVTRVTAILFDLQSRGALERATTSDPANFETAFEALKRA